MNNIIRKIITLCILLAPLTSSAGGPAVKITTQTYDGNMGGNFGVTRKCQDEYPKTRMCSVEEVATAIKIPRSFSGEAWVHAPACVSGTIINACLVPAGINCISWTSSSVTDSGQVVLDNGNMSNTFKACSGFKPIACCKEYEND